MKPYTPESNLTLEILAGRIETMRKGEQSAKDKAIKNLQAQLDELKASHDELQDLVLQLVRAQ